MNLPPPMLAAPETGAANRPIIAENLSRRVMNMPGFKHRPILPRLNHPCHTAPGGRSGSGSFDGCCAVRGDGHGDAPLSSFPIRVFPLVSPSDDGKDHTEVWGKQKSGRLSKSVRKTASSVSFYDPPLRPGKIFRLSGKNCPVPSPSNGTLCRVPLKSSAFPTLQARHCSVFPASEAECEGRSEACKMRQSCV